MLGYLCRLNKRMEKRNFPHDDTLLRTVVKAYGAIHALNVEVHYLSCKSGVGREQRWDGKRGTNQNSDRSPFS